MEWRKLETSNFVHWLLTSSIISGRGNGHMTSKFWEIIDNMSKMLPDRETSLQRKTNGKSCMDYRMARLPIREAEGHVCYKPL